METERFDRLIKSLATPATRRGLLHRLGAGLLAGILAMLLGDGSAVTAKTRRQQRDDDHGSSHRRHRRKAKHRHRPGKDKENRKGKRRGKRKHTTPGPCAGCIDGSGACQPGDTAAACGRNGVVCTSCTGGRACVGNGVCAFGCLSPAACPSGCSCEENESGGPLGVCVIRPDPVSPADCTTCAAQGQVCFEICGGCPPSTKSACATPC